MEAQPTSNSRCSSSSLAWSSGLWSAMVDGDSGRGMAVGVYYTEVDALCRRREVAMLSRGVALSRRAKSRDDGRWSGRSAAVPVVRWPKVEMTGAGACGCCGQTVGGVTGNKPDGRCGHLQVGRQYYGYAPTT